MCPHARDIAPVPLEHLAVLRIAGADAAAFLQGQLTSDTRLLADGRTQSGACTTPQGRVIAVLRLRLAEGTVWAVLPRDLVEAVTRHLRRYVLRSKVTIDAPSELGLWRVDAGTRAGSAAGIAFDFADGRRLVAASDESLPSMNRNGPPRSAAAADLDWRAADIAAGLPQVFAATSGAFIPQMLNLDLLDAVSFSKGCYAGQEIVARTQHLGRIKRRSFRYHLAPGPAPAPLAGLHRDGSKVAEVLDAVSRDDGVELLAVTSLEARGVPLLAEDGRVATPLGLPYLVPAGG